MIRYLIARGMAALALLSLVFASPALADITVKDGAGATQTLRSFACGSAQCYGLANVNTSGVWINPATSDNQAPLTPPGTPGANGTTVTSFLPQITATAGNAISFGTTAATLFNANPTRHFITIQVQGAPDTTGANGCYINGIANATADANSLFIPRGGYFESSTHVGVAAVGIICTGTMAVYSRQG